MDPIVARAGRSANERRSVQPKGWRPSATIHMLKYWLLAP
jgi:hypothetical protein